MTDRERDLLGFPLTGGKNKPSQLPLKLSMGVSIRWGAASLTVSKDPACGSIVAFPVDLPELGARWAHALKALYPGRKPGELDHKRCAKDLGVSPRTAEGWAGGQEPSGKYLWVALGRHGRRMLALLAPELAPPTAMELLRVAESLCSSSAELAGAIAKLAKGGADVDDLG
ncbi:MAG: hypothetical protein H7Y60_09180 [Rhodospirillaceae bacterium]|nr:hypothetical protein [Rhodospirillales bacterium]